jgi:hypothetical protein
MLFLFLNGDKSEPLKKNPLKKLGIDINFIIY